MRQTIHSSVVGEPGAALELPTTLSLGPGRDVAPGAPAKPA